MSRLQARFKLAYGGFKLDVDLDVPAEGVTVVAVKQPSCAV